MNPKVNAGAVDAILVLDQIEGEVELRIFQFRELSLAHAALFD